MATRREILQCQYNRGGAESPNTTTTTTMESVLENNTERGSSTFHTNHTTVPIPFLGGSEAAEEALLVALQTRINIDAKKVKEYTHQTKEEVHKFQARCLEDIAKSRALAAAAATKRPWSDNSSTEGGQRKAQSSRDFDSIIPHAEGQHKDDLDVAVHESGVGRLQSDHVTAGQASKQRPRKFSLKKVRTRGSIALF